VAEVNSKGYGGPIHMLVGIDLRRSVEGVEIVDQTETPGLGTQVKKAGFSRQFRGFDKSGDVKVTKDGGRVQAITGATISSRAVSAGVAAGIDAIKNLPETR
jgi:electron transport complex protein RnfG